MAIITPTLLGSINNGLTLAYNTQLYAAEGIYKKFCFLASSTGGTEVYPRLDQLKGLREWIGARQIQRLSQSNFSIVNQKFEQTIAIDRSDLSDDKYGVYAPVAAEMGENARRQPDLMVAKLINNGTVGLGFDNQPMFSTTHPGFDVNGNATTYSNFTAGGGPTWYLMDTGRVLQPFIFQTREAFELVARFSPTDPNVFENDEFVWGQRGRCAAGYGLPHLIYASQLPLTPQNVVSARTAMAQIRRADGSPMGIRADTIMVSSTLLPTANVIYKADLIGNDPTTPTTLVANVAMGLVQPLENVWLN